MSQRAACQLEQIGFIDVHDFVVGKAHWLASGRPTERTTPIDRVGDHLTKDVAVVHINATVADAHRALTDHDSDHVVVVNTERVVLGSARSAAVSAAASQTPIADVMNTGPTTIRPDEDRAAVQQRMTRHHVAELIVTTPTGKLLGLFTTTNDTT